MRVGDCEKNSAEAGCHQCGVPMAMGGSTCPSCGAQQTKVCELCGTTHFLKDLFCPGCVGRIAYY